MARKKLDRQEVITQLVEERDTLSRLIAPVKKMNSVVVEAINITIRRVDEIMERDLESTSWESVERAELEQDIQDITTADLEQIRQRIARWCGKIRSNAKYVTAVEGYRGQDNPRTGQLFKRGLNQFLETHVYSEIDVEADQLLYHGVETSENADFENISLPGKKRSAPTPMSLRNPAEYAETLKKITQAGLRASPAPENLPDLESVFLVQNPVQSYGLAGVRFPFGTEDKAWGLTYDPVEGIQIVKPALKRPFQVYLKSPDFLDLTDKDSDGYENKLSRIRPDQFIDYQLRLSEELTKRGIRYVVIDPDGGVSEEEI